MTDEATVTDNTPTDSTVTTAGDEKPAVTTTGNEKPADQSTQTTETPPGAPEKYEPFTLPDDVKLDETLMGEFSQLAKDSNLPQDKAQSLVELGAKMAKGFDSAAQKSLDDLKSSFETDLKNDTQLGGEKLGESMAVAQRGLDAYGSKELKDMLAKSGLGKHPELVRYFHAVGQTVSEDNIADSGSDNSGGGDDLASRMYPNQTNAA